MGGFRWLLLVVLLPACVAEPPYHCTSGGQCARSGGSAGTCEPSGFCSFADPGCGGGRRYGSHAGDGLAGVCVDDGVSDGGLGDRSVTPDAGSGLGARLISSSYYTDWNGSATYEYPPEMSKTGYHIRTDGVVDGDLLLIIANVDNGSGTVWPSPVAPGFTQLAENFFGNDGQTYVVAWKIAAGEPTSYAGAYGNGIGSSSAVLHLIAVSGASASSPINDFRTQFGSGTGADPVLATSPGVTTTVPGCLIIYAAGVDWESAPGSNTSVPPAGYTVIADLGDRGDMTWDWTSQHIATRLAPTAGPTGPITATFDGPHKGLPWTAVIAIAPR